MKLTAAYHGGTRYDIISGAHRVVISTKGLSVEAEWTMAEQPHRVGQITLAIHLPHRVTAEQSERLLKVAHGCTVHQSLAVPAVVAIELNSHHRGEKPS
jgi:uncharacterized OsmC-like protein